MQICACDPDPQKAARHLTNPKQIVKMPLECIQILTGAHHYLGGLPAGAPADAYKYSNKNHPCIVWTATSVGNYTWMLAYTHEIFAIFDELKRRNHARDVAVGKPPSAVTVVEKHASFRHLEWLERCVPACPGIGRTPFALVINDAELLRMGVTQPRDQLDVCATYRLYASEAMVKLRFDARADLRRQMAARKVSERSRVVKIKK